MNRQTLIAALLLLLPLNAHAHLVSTRFGDFYSGLLHPTTSLEHLLPWLALGFLAGLQSRDVSRWSVLVFPLAVCAGVTAGTLWVDVPAVATLNLASFVVLGGLAALAMRLRLAALVALCVLFGLSHGWGNGAAMRADGNVLLYALGVTTSGYLAIALVAASARALSDRWGWGSIAVRAAGSWITAVGVLMLGLGLQAIG